MGDRVAQTVVKKVLEPLVEPRFHEDSYAYRPGKSALDAVGKRTACVTLIPKEKSHRLGLRASALDRVGGWDECIGPGTKFGSGDDDDIAVKVLRDGQRIAFVPEAGVAHHDRRSRAATRSPKARLTPGTDQPALEGRGSARPSG